MILDPWQNPNRNKVIHPTYYVSHYALLHSLPLINVCILYLFRGVPYVSSYPCNVIGVIEYIFVSIYVFPFICPSVSSGTR